MTVEETFKGCTDEDLANYEAEFRMDMQREMRNRATAEKAVAAFLSDLCKVKAEKTRRDRANGAK